MVVMLFFFFSSRRRHTRSDRDWSSDVCSSDLSGTAGSYTLRFESGTLTTATSGTITLGAGAAATLVKSSGDNLTGQVATRLQTPHVVLISDANSNPVAGVTVTWAAASAAGSVDPTTSTT